MAGIIPPRVATMTDNILALVTEAEKHHFRQKGVSCQQEDILSAIQNPNQTLSPVHLLTDPTVSLHFKNAIMWAVVCANRDSFDLSCVRYREFGWMLLEAATMADNENLFERILVEFSENLHPSRWRCFLPRLIYRLVLKHHHQRLAWIVSLWGRLHLFGERNFLYVSLVYDIIQACYQGDGYKLKELKLWMKVNNLWSVIIDEISPSLAQSLFDSNQWQLWPLISSWICDEATGDLFRFFVGLFANEFDGLLDVRFRAVMEYMTRAELPRASVQYCGLNLNASQMVVMKIIEWAALSHEREFVVPYSHHIKRVLCWMFPRIRANPLFLPIFDKMTKSCLLFGVKGFQVYRELSRLYCTSCPERWSAKNPTWVEDAAFQNWNRVLANEGLLGVCSVHVVTHWSERRNHKRRMMSNLFQLRAPLVTFFTTPYLSFE
jgi:hypothetical protein